MNQQPDKLFRDKLENYQRTVPVSAWDRISATQEKKKPNSPWLKVAASLLLIAVAGSIWVLIQWDATDSSPLAENHSATTLQPSNQLPVNPTPALGPKLADTTGATLPSIDSQGKTTFPLTNKAARETKVPSKQAIRNTSPDAKITHTNQPAVAGSDNGLAMRKSTSGISDLPEAPSIPSNELQPEKSALTTDAIGMTGFASAPAARGVTLSYTTEDVSTYLNKNIDDKATDDDKKQSTLKKLLQKANDLKTNQDPFGELRQRKNEILALNFKNDKRGQKTRN